MTQAKKKKITQKQINDVMSSLEKKSGDPISYLLELAEKEQPALLEYILDADENLNDDENDLLMTTALTGWYIVRETLGCRIGIDVDTIDECIESSIELFDGEIFNRADGKAGSPLELLSRTNNQEELMSFLTGLIIVHPENFTGVIREDMTLSMVIHLKSVIDCLVSGESGPVVKYSDEDFKAVQKTLGELFASYRKSAPYMKLGHEEKEEAEYIVTVFGEMMYSYHLQKPGEWTVASAVKCCVETMPGKIVAEAEFFKLVEPVIRSFVQFASENGAVPRGRLIAEALEGIGSAIVKMADNPSAWGFGKQLGMDAERAGVDLTDEKAMNKFIMERNREMAERGRKSVPGRNDPCPCGSGKKFKKCCGAG